MKYSKEERIDIGAKIYNNEITKYEAAEKYEISVYSAREYMRMYRDTHGLPEKSRSKEVQQVKIIEQAKIHRYEEYESMTKDELIRELVKARINEARLKKGYEVKGAGVEKVFVPLDNKNTK